MGYPDFRKSVHAGGQWLEDLNSSAPISISRCYFPSLSPIDRIAPHIFSYASNRACAAVGFQVTKSDENGDTSFAFAKCKATPINQVTA